MIAALRRWRERRRLLREADALDVETMVRDAVSRATPQSGAWDAQTDWARNRAHALREEASRP